MLVTSPRNPLRLRDTERAVQTFRINTGQMPHFVVGGHQLRFCGMGLSVHGLLINYQNRLIRTINDNYIDNHLFVNRQFLSYSLTGMNPKQLVAANIRYMRKRLFLTQAEAAERIGVTQSTWQTYESGNVSIGIEVLADIARALDVTMADLVSINVESERLQAKKAQARHRKAA